ncbi:MAG: aldehyde ferredoxin oxidoreductase N-terminal domain-containing protein [Chloroflexota bacterium]
MLGKDYIRVLYIDLSSRRVDVQQRQDLVAYMGGSGVAVKLLAETIQTERDVFDPAQPMIIAIGPLSTIFPVITKAAATFRSPLTGEYGESHAGGRIAYALSHAGYDALVVTGKAEHPSYLLIHDNRVEVRDAGVIWGTDTLEAGRILRSLHTAPGHRSIIRIGPAGEKLVRFANVNVETYRHFGRLGLGAVFGAKNLKAIVTIGTHHFPLGDLAQSYRKVYAEVYRKVTETDAMEKYHELGTPMNVAPLNELGALPTRNLQATRFEGAEAISGESLARENLMFTRACAGCQIGCIHVALLRQPFGEPDWYHFDSSLVPYDHELIYALGSMLGVGERQDLLMLIEEADVAGMDAISTGVTLAWATEAMQRGLISAAELGVELRFGDAPAYRHAVRAIAESETDLARWLARGSLYAAQHYGGQDFAVALGGGHGMAGYHTGYANVVGHHIGARHSHLDNAGYAIDQKSADLTDEETVEALIAEEQERAMLTSLSICLFARKVYDRQTVKACLASVGMPWSDAQLDELGRKIYALRLDIKRRLGYDPTQVPIPQRFFDTPSMRGPLAPERVQRMLAIYRQRAAAIQP